MALGYENTGIGPRLIANAGNAMTESIRQFGEKLQKDIVSHNTDKQVAGFLQEAQSLNLDSPTFQGDLVGVLAKYPMAAGDQRALMGAKLLATGWEQKQASKEAVQRFEERKTLAGMRNTGGSNTPFTGIPGMGLDLPTLPPSGESDLVGAGDQVLGAMSPLGVPFNPQTEIPVSRDEALFSPELQTMNRRLVATEVPATVAKRQIANQIGREAAQATRPKSQEDITIYQDESGNTYEFGRKTGWRGEPPPDNTTIFRPGAPRDQFKVAGGVFMNPKTGQRIDPGISQAKQADLNARERKADFEATKIRITELQKQRDDMRRLGAQAEKAGDVPAAQARFGVAEDITKGIDTLARGLTKEERIELGVGEVVESDRVTVEKDGKRFTLPKSQLEDAKKEGYNLVE